MDPRGQSIQRFDPGTGQHELYRWDANRGGYIRFVWDPNRQPEPNWTPQGWVAQPPPQENVQPSLLHAIPYADQFNLRTQLPPPNGRRPTPFPMARLIDERRFVRPDDYQGGQQFEVGGGPQWMMPAVAPGQPPHYMGHYVQPAGEPQLPPIFNSSAENLPQAIERLRIQGYPSTTGVPMFGGSQLRADSPSFTPANTSRASSPGRRQSEQAALPAGQGAAPSYQGQQQHPPSSAAASDRVSMPTTGSTARPGSLSSPGQGSGGTSTPPAAATTGGTRVPRTPGVTSSAPGSLPWGGFLDSSEGGPSTSNAQRKAKGRASLNGPLLQAGERAFKDLGLSFGAGLSGDDPDDFASSSGTDGTEGQPGSLSSTFGDRSIFNPAEHRPYDQEMLKSEAAEKAERDWSRFISNRFQNVLRGNGANSIQHQLDEIARDLARYRQLDRGPQAILPAKPATNTLPKLRSAVVANFVKLNVHPAQPEKWNKITLYTLSWNSGRRKLMKEDKLHLWWMLMNTYGRNTKYFNRVASVYDGGSLVVAAGPYNFPENQLKSSNGVQLEVERLRPTLKYRENLDVEEFNTFIRKPEVECQFPKNVILTFNAIVKQYCIKKSYIESGRHYFDPGQRDTQFTRDLFDSMPGFFQSVRALQGGLLINVDVTNAVFYKPGQPLHEAWEKVVQFYLPETKKRVFENLRYFIDEWGPDHVSILREFWRNLKIMSDHRIHIDDGKPNPTFVIWNASLSSAKNQEVVIRFGKDENKRTDLIEFLKDRYRLNGRGQRGPRKNLFEKMPALKISKKFDYYLPWGVCYTTQGSRFGGKLEKAELLKKLAPVPEKRLRSIEEFVARRHIRDPPTNNDTSGQRDDFDAEFGLELGTQLMSVEPRKVAPPLLEISNHGFLPVDDLRGTYNLKAQQKFAEPVVIRNWAVLSLAFPVYQRQEEDRYIDGIVRCANEKGIQWSRDPTVRITMPEGNRKDTFDIKRDKLRDQLSKLKNEFEATCRNLRNRSGGPGTGEENAVGPKLDIVLCFMYQRMTPEYATLKAYCDMTLGWHTQVVLMSRKQLGDERGISRSYFENIVLKINAKCGGQNFVFRMETINQMPLLQNSILFGADVTHPPPSDIPLPSIAAVVASTDRIGIRYACRIRPQEGRKEAITDLQFMVEELLTEHESRAGGLPENILFFRDGVSETQFVTTLRYEGIAILDAAERCYGRNRRPKLFIILAVKRHHTRFFVKTPGRNQTTYTAQNIPSGSLVDEVVTHPRQYDFFLCSQHPGQGTSRPTHYHVLLDQIAIAPNDLYQLVYNLCHVYQRCTRPVSLVTPVFYAHLAAFRAKHYLEYVAAEYREKQKMGYNDPPPAPMLADYNAHPDLRNHLWFL